MSACSLSMDIPGVLTAANDWIEIKVHTAGRRLAGVTFTDKLNGCAYRFGDDIFSIHLDYGIKEDGVTDDVPHPRPRKISAAGLMVEKPAGPQAGGPPFRRQDNSSLCLGDGGPGRHLDCGTEGRISLCPYFAGHLPHAVGLPHSHGACA